MKGLDCIAIDKDILGGIPVFKGTRVPITNLFDYLKAGDSLNDFLKDFDYIPRDYCIEVLAASQFLLTDQLIKISKPKPSDFRGKLDLTGEQYESLQEHLKDIRNEWDREF